MRAFRFLPILLLAGCGQSGDLYLPAEEPPPPPPATAPAPAEPPAGEAPDKDRDKK